MFQMYEKQTKSGAREVLRGLARQLAVLIATLALFGSLYLGLLLGE